MAKFNQMAAMDEEFKVGRLESKVKDYEVNIAELQQEVDRLRSEVNSSSEAFDGTIDPNLLVPSRWQPRTNFDPVEMQELEDSIVAPGEVIVPVLLLRDTNELIAGERRTRIAIKLGLVVKYRRIYVSDEVAADYTALENIKRADLNPIDETNMVLDTIARKLNLDSRIAAATLIRQIKNELGGQVSKNNVILKETAQAVEGYIKQFTKGSLSLTSFASNRLKLLNIDEDVKQAIAKGEVDYTKGIEIAKIKDDRTRANLLERAIKEDLGIREVRKEATKLKPEKKAKSNDIQPSTKERTNSDSQILPDNVSNGIETNDPNRYLESIDRVETIEADLSIVLEEKSEQILYAIRNESLSASRQQELNLLLDRAIAMFS